MRTPFQWPLKRSFILLSLMTALALPGTSPLAEENLYRVEILVFRHLNGYAEPAEVTPIRGFHALYDLDKEVLPGDPVRLEKQDGTFANIWSRLRRLADYEPLARLTYEQSQYDFHPPVRLHNEEIMAEELHFPGDVVYITPDGIQNPGLFDAYVAPLYRLDGSVQLRRSRFLHIDLDLEYRLDGPAWFQSYPPLDGFVPEQTAPAAATEPPVEDLFGMIGDLEAMPEMDAPGEPFKVHRLQQSRQVRSNNLHYFDTEFLGAIVRITPIAPE